eukprot:457978_1
MGIDKLLQELKPITKPVKLHELRGQTCGVDASCWLHRASYSCALCLVSGKNTTKYLQFTLNSINLLKRFDITPIMVFDGAHLPMKANENHRRNVVRERAKNLALLALESLSISLFPLELDQLPPLSQIPTLAEIQQIPSIPYTGHHTSNSQEQQNSYPY